MKLILGVLACGAALVSGCTANPAPPAASTPSTGFNKSRGFNGAVLALAEGTGGDLYVGGSFTTYRQTASNRLIRLLSDGSAATDLNIGTGFDGDVYAVVRALDGSGDVYAAGAFTQFNGASVGRIARLNSNGSLDTAFGFGAGFNGTVYALALDGFGNVYAGGDFTAYAGVPNNRIVRLAPTGTIDGGFNTGGAGGGFNASVVTLVLTGGLLYAGGDFTTYGGTGSERIVRLNSTGGVDLAFSPGFNSTVKALALATDGSGDLYVGGWFSTYQGNFHKYIVRLNSNGSFDAGFAADTAFNSGVSGLAVSALNNSDVMVCGSFTMYNAAAANGMARLKSDGTQEPSFAVGSGLPSSESGGVILASSAFPALTYVGGEFTAFNGVGCDRLVRVKSDGAMDTAFNRGAGFDNYSMVLALAPGDGGSSYPGGLWETAYIGGSFTTFNGTGVTSAVRLMPDGTLDTNFAAGTFNSYVSAVLVDHFASRVYVGGAFSYPRNRLVCLDANGQIDTTFDVGIGFDTGAVNALAFANDGTGDIWVGGTFTRYKGEDFRRIVRLQSDGSKRSTFNAGGGAGGFNGDVNALVAEGDGSVFVGGNFTAYKGVSQSRIARIDSAGNAVGSFATGSGFNQAVYALAKSSSLLYVGGNFTSYKGVAGKNRIIGLDFNGDELSGFTVGTGCNSTVYGLLTKSYGGFPGPNVYLGGAFTSYNGVTYNGLVRLDSAGVPVPEFDPGAGFNGSVRALCFSGDKLYVGGNFTSYGTTTMDKIALLNRLTGAPE